MDARYTAEEQRRLERNTARLEALLATDPLLREPGGMPLSLQLERMVIDPVTGHVVSYDDDPGLGQVLEALASSHPSCSRLYKEGVLVAVGDVLGAPGEGVVPVRVSLSTGGQLRVSVGPSLQVASLLDTLEGFDEWFRCFCNDAGLQWQMVALGVNPLPLSPREVPLLPLREARLLDDYLAEKGRYARDMLRLTASTRVAVQVPPSSLMAVYRVAVSLGPILSFLCDNVSSWRGLASRDTPRMARSRIWDHVDPERCSVVPGALSEGFSVHDYVDWMLGLKAVAFVPDEGPAFSTGSATVRDVMALRDLSDAELGRLLAAPLPTVRLCGLIEIRDADAMPPRLAAAYAAFIKGLLGNPDALAVAQELLVRGRDDADVRRAYEELRREGWDAQVYGRPVSSLVQRLIQLAENGLTDPKERVLFHALSSLWQAHLVPKDLYREEPAA